MAKTHGSLFSLNAHGSVAKTLTFSKRKSGQQCRSYNKPLKSPSPKQSGQRRLTEFLVAQWQNMSDVDKATWDASARVAGLNIAGYHYFLRQAQRDLYTHHGLLAYWHCNEFVGGQVLDLSGQGNHGTPEPSYPSNAPVLVASRTSKFGKALLFDGIDEYVDCGSEIIPYTTDFFVEAWIYCEGERGGGTDDKGTVFGTGFFSTSILGITVRLDSTSKDLDVTWGDGTTDTKLRLITDCSTTNRQRWYHILVAWDVSLGTMYAYTDGILVASEAHDILASTKTFNFGRSAALNSAESYWYGKIDEVCIYNRLPSANEVLRRYNFGLRSAR